jgi:hypothetical protein
MELKVSKITVEEENSANSERLKTSAGDKLNVTDEKADTPLKTLELENGITLINRGEEYYIAVDGQLLPITEEEACYVYENPENAFDLVIRKKRKFWFNASLDNVGQLFGDVE